MTNRREFLKISATAPLMCVPPQIVSNKAGTTAVPPEKDAVRRLRELCITGLKERYQKNTIRFSCGELSRDVIERLDEELAVIQSVDATQDFLRLYEIVQFVRNRHGYLRARGTAVGSLVNYALGVSPVCPVEHGLIWEPFLSPANASPRSMLAYVSSGPDEPNTMAADIVVHLSEQLGYRRDGPAHVLPGPNSDARHDSATHLTFVTLWELAILARTVDLVRRTHGVRLDLDSVPLTDESTFELLANGDTDHIFGLNDEWSKDLLRQIRPTCFRHVLDSVALSRPALDYADHRRAEAYVEQRPRWQTALHPLYTPILKRSRGVLLYQEQVMKILHRIAGIPPAVSFELVKAICRRDAVAIARIGEAFLSGARIHGIATMDAGILFEKLISEAGSSRCESHVAAEAFLICQMAFLKAHYRREFLVAAEHEQKKVRTI
ncbi:MAG: hypothetical protein DWQ35_13945 [Planctomycetota bacterium]|nr:MAG: hypothetical protein DWQ35_13945 [Planctomycetota bacterium]REK25954.1 MAG: hypothetical protein DWQ42_10010 [Planctomycetota bacterium]REK46930.1 MAG: hypothetical protein DWQ46_05390 [Planctomycetota bacterium]